MAFLWLINPGSDSPRIQKPEMKKTGLSQGVAEAHQYSGEVKRYSMVLWLGLVFPSEFYDCLDFIQVLTRRKVPASCVFTPQSPRPRFKYGALARTCFFKAESLKLAVEPEAQLSLSSRLVCQVMMLT